MRRTLYLKMLIGFLIYGILGFLLIATFTNHYTSQYLEKKEASNLYREANLIANNYAKNYYNH